MKKNNYRIIPLVFFLSFNTHAIDCVGMKNNEVLRLDTTGKSLQNFRVQDQDGVGSCYANTTSLLLQGTLKNNPAISYYQMAVMSAASDLEKKRIEQDSSVEKIKYAEEIESKKKDDKVVNPQNSDTGWKLLLEGGRVCDVVNNVKKIQKETGKNQLCPREKINIENYLNNDVGAKQFSMTLASSKYMDSIQSFFKQDGSEDVIMKLEKLSQYKEALKNFLENKKEHLSKNGLCRIDIGAIQGALQPVIQKDLKTNAKCLEKKVPLKKNLKSKKNSSTDENNESFYCKLTRALAGEIVSKTDFSFEAKGLNIEAQNSLRSKLTGHKFPLTADQLNSDIVSSVMGTIKGEKWELEALKKQLTILLGHPDFKNKLDEVAMDFNDISKDGLSKRCENRQLINYLSSKKFEKDIASDFVLCNYTKMTKEAGAVIVGNEQISLKNIEKVFDFLINDSAKKYDDALLSLYAIDCHESDKISLPDNLQCKSEQVKKEEKEFFDQKILAKLRKNQPIGLTMCAAILDKPKREFALGECGGHAVAVVGMKCENGGLKYLVQNSWGTESKAKNPAIENVTGRGAYWFDSTSFYDSANWMISLEMEN